MLRRACPAPFAALVLALFSALPLAAQQVPTPRAYFGFELGEDRKLANWSQLSGYYEQLAETSDRVRVDTLGTTTMGRPFIMLTITSAANHARLAELQEVQRRLADPRRIRDDGELTRLLDEGRTVVMITHNIHSTEVGGAQVAGRLAHRLASSNEADVLEILDNVILLQIPSLNPDGTDWVSDWYMETVGGPFEGTAPPWLYHYYTGHDNNRDWYAFTQEETVHTVRAQNAWHPQIVHDIHQMGGGGARIFFPPYIEPWEPNVDAALTAGVSQLGSWMAASLLAEGKRGAVINATYDAFTPARAYMHYHGGVRILSETASAQLATPTDVPAERVRGGRNYDASQRSWNFPAPWEGGRWGLPEIVAYMDAGAMALLQNAARNRRYWLENFHGVNARAVAAWPEWPAMWVIPAEQANTSGLAYVLRTLTLADVEVHRAGTAFSAGGRTYPAGTYVVPMNQPYASFAQTMLERQRYPDLREYPGGPPLRPYDVTAHTLPLLMDVEAVAIEDGAVPPLSAPIPEVDFTFTLPAALRGPNAPRIGYYKSAQEPMEGGWTRWVFDRHALAYDTLKDARIRAGGLASDYDVILLQAQAGGSILHGYAEGSRPAEYTGGIGEEGAAALRAFVEEGGRIVAVEEATDFVAELLGLGVRDAVAELPNTEFYVPGSIVRLDLEPGHALAAGLDPQVHGWYWGSSRAFAVDEARATVVARYGPGDPVVSGWILGPEHLAGQPAVVQAQVGRGSVVLFGFQPNYRAQTVATWPLLFNALTVPRR